MASGRRRRTCALSSDPVIGPVRIRPAAMRPALPQTVLGLSLKNEADSTFSQVVPQTEPAFQVQPDFGLQKILAPASLDPPGRAFLREMEVIPGDAEASPRAAMP